MNTPITLRGGREVGIGGELVDLVRTSTTTLARGRITGEPRDVVFCWDDWKGIALWTGQVRAQSTLPVVDPARTALRGAGGCEIALPATLIMFVELEPGEYVVCWQPKTADARNVACFTRDCTLKWLIGDAPGQPPCAYHGVALRPGDRLEAYAKGRGYLGIVDRDTGAIIATAPYH